VSDYRCMCCDDHEPIGFTRDDESCPLCDALTARDAALERARVLANEVRAYRHPDSEHVDKTGHILTLRYSGDTIDELMKARASTDAANALGGEQ